MCENYYGARGFFFNFPQSYYISLLLFQSSNSIITAYYLSESSTRERVKERGENGELRNWKIELESRRVSRRINVRCHYENRLIMLPRHISPSDGEDKRGMHSMQSSEPDGCYAGVCLCLDAFAPRVFARKLPCVSEWASVVCFCVCLCIYIYLCVYIYICVRVYMCRFVARRSLIVKQIHFADLLCPYETRPFVRVCARREFLRFWRAEHIGNCIHHWF